MSDRIPASLLTAVTDFLRRHPPFDGMEPDALKFLAGRLQLSYHPRDSVVQSPAQGEAETLFIVQRGIVRVRNADAHQPVAGAWIALRAGESFSVGALLESLSYERVLERGFALVHDGGGHPVTSAAMAKPGMEVGIRFRDGEAGAVIAGAPAAKPANPAKPSGKKEPPQGSLL